MRLIFVLIFLLISKISVAQNFEINLKLIDQDGEIDSNKAIILTTFNKRGHGIKHQYIVKTLNNLAIIKDTINSTEVAMLSIGFKKGSSAIKIIIEPNAAYQVVYNISDHKYDVQSNSDSDNLMRYLFTQIDSLVEIKNKRLDLMKQFEAANNKKAADSMLILINAFEEDSKVMTKTIAFNNPNSIISPYILLNKRSYDVEEQKIYENLTDKIKKTKYGVQLKEDMDFVLKNHITKNNIEILSEKLFPIKGSTINNKNVILDTAYFKKSKSKLTLIEFWASWCIPCKESLKKIYPFYYTNKSKGFDVILVSLDDDSEKWKQTSLADNYPWLNISDKKGHKSDIAKNYKINAIPANILINFEGKIIARNVFNFDFIEKILER